ncbi:MAG: hypothetical protein ABSG90_14095 [Dehalococcoidia bacterium]
MQVLDPLTDLYSHKRRAGMLSNAVRKTTAPTAPVMSGPGIADMPEGFQEGGMLAGPIDWAKRNIVQPVQNFVSNLAPSTPAPVNPTPPPQNIGTGYVQQSGVQPIQRYNQNYGAALREASEGYAEGGGVDDPLKKLPTQWPVTAAGVAPVAANITTPPVKVAQTPVPQVAPTPTAANAYGTASPLTSLPHGAEGSYEAPVAAAPKVPAVAPPPPVTATDTAVKAATAPPPGATSTGTDPLTNVSPDGSGFAQVGQKKIGINDIGVQGKDPLTAGTGTINELSEEQFKRSGLAADPNFGKTGFEYNTATKTWEKPDPEIMVGNPQGIMSTMKESEAFNKGLMSPYQRESYLNRQIFEKQAALTAQSTGAEIAEKQATAHLKEAQGEYLKGGGSITNTPLTDEQGRPIYRNKGGKEFVHDDDGNLIPHTGKSLNTAATKLAEVGQDADKLGKMLASGEMAPAQVKNAFGIAVSNKAVLAAKEQNPDYNAETADANYSWYKNPQTQRLIRRTDSIIDPEGTIAESIRLVKAVDNPAGTPINKLTGKVAVAFGGSKRLLLDLATGLSAEEQQQIFGSQGGGERFLELAKEMNNPNLSAKQYIDNANEMRYMIYTRQKQNVAGTPLQKKYEKLGKDIAADRPGMETAPAGASAIPQAAIDHLKTNPSLKAHFDEKYGKGASDKYLGAQ